MKKIILLNLVVLFVITGVLKAGKIYFTDRDTGSIYQANLDGTEKKKIVSTPNPVGIALDVAGGKMYWTSYQTNTNCTIRRANLDGTAPEVIITGGISAPSGVALDIAGEKIYWIEDNIKRANLNGSGTENIISGTQARDIALDLHAGKIYWTNITNAYGGVGTRTIERANLDGTNKEIIVGQLGTPDGIALDTSNGKMYWTDQSTDKIQRANMNGTEIEDLVTAGVDRPYGIALDLPGGKMYWTDWGTKKIQRANLDGTMMEDIITTGLVLPLFIAIDVVPEPVTLLGIEIVGPQEVPENFGANYKALAVYSTGSRKDITNSTIWSVEPGTYAGINADGLLLTGDINIPQNITIHAQCTIDEVMYEAEMSVQITLAHTFYVPSEYNTIQAAINECIDGDVVIVAPGTYTGLGNRDIDFLGKAVTVRSIDPQDQNVVAATIIDCENESCGFDFHNGEDSYSVLDGLIITRGYHYDSGGGIRCYKSSPTIKNCIITGNSAQYCGGGMFNNYSDPTLINCTFTKNSAPDRGGAIWCHSGSNPHLVNCSFIQNSAGSGGAISEGSPTVINCSFYKNSAAQRGGGILSNDDSPKLTNCIFTGNSAESGGAIYNAASTGNSSSSPAVNNCVFIKNTATGNGGAILNSSGTGDSKASPIIMNCLFVGNKTVSFGGGMYNSSGTGNAKTKPTVINCTFSSNSAASGGGMYNRRGILASDTIVTINNSIFWDNDGNNIVVASGSMAVSYSCIQSGFDGIGNIDADPCFVNEDANDYHLKLASPCINTGDPNFIPEPNETDLDGLPRVIGGRVDMGAYEFNHQPIAVAGPNQTTYAWIDGHADVNLDGSGSYDDDNDVLDFFWSWTINDSNYEANGVNPTITLPAGNHTVELIVDDGIDLSEPDYCRITVIKAIRGKLLLNPQVIQTKISLGTPNGGSGKWIIATLFILPVPGEQINKEQPLRLYPLGIEAKYQRFYKYGMFQRGPSFAVAFFDKQQVVDALGLGTTKVDVVGEFQSGRYFFGSDNIKIISPKPKPPNPWHW